MSTLETNAIGKYSGNNVSVDDALNLKSYTLHKEMLYLHKLVIQSIILKQEQ